MATKDTKDKDSVKVVDLIIGSQFYMCGQPVEVLMIHDFTHSRQTKVRWMRDGAVSVHMLKKQRVYRKRV